MDDADCVSNLRCSPLRWSAPAPTSMAIVYLNGRLLEETEAAISPFDRGFTYGDGLFETLRIYRGKPFDLVRHLERLRRGAACLGFPEVPDWEEAVGGVIAANGVREGVLRIALSRGVGRRGLLPPVESTPVRLATVAAGDPCPASFREGVRGIMVTNVRRNEFSPLTGLKTASALELVLTRREAAARGAVEGILLNTRGNLAEGTYTNLFLARGGQLRTPSPAAGILPGIVRGRILELATAAGHPVLEKTDIPPIELLKADEAFLTNSLLEVMPLLEVDGGFVGDGKPGPLTRKMQRAYGQLVWDKLG